MIAATSPRLLDIIEEKDRTIARFIPPASVTEENAEKLEQELDSLVEGKSPLSLSIDLGTLDFVSSVGLTKFIALHKKVTAASGYLVFFNLKPDIRRVFEVSRLDRLLHIQTECVPPAV